MALTPSYNESKTFIETRTRSLPNREELTRTAVRHGRSKKRSNAIVAVLCGVLPAVALSLHLSSHGWGLEPVAMNARLFWDLAVGLIWGLVWGNAFEYVYHRWLLHGSGNPHAAVHREHHAQIGTPEQAEYVALISSPLNVVLLFVVNGVLALLLLLIGLRGVLAGLFLGWAVYVIVTEEMHWRIHMNGWLPPGLRFARAYHMSHHARPDGRYNVFLPAFDYVLGSTERGA
jgi:hypothetical protein